MTVASLAGPAVAAAVVGDDPIALVEEEQHLGVPVIGRKRPAMAEHDGLTFAPVLVVDLNPILGLDCRHFSLLEERHSREFRGARRKRAASMLVWPLMRAAHDDDLMDGA